ncbi:PA14 domain-containing protein [Cohnella faecalis]|uniref:PA14 domain-containing protein n=1 Tax=Cohnella faecalis TaxID=2315694 RepID=A0A398CX46_9BACL|nr:PA14 domain-containing protein [Cohnella faecalis]RIE03781.1 hypothetical protein D3H35_09515 [Cohnella faecalis]
MEFRFLRPKWVISTVAVALISLLLWLFASWDPIPGQSDYTASASSVPVQGELNRSYVDWKQQQIPFGVSSFDLAPWRSYMDTWDASRYLETLGVVFNVSDNEADATAQLLSEAGVRSARVEIGWGNISFDNEAKLKEPQIKGFEKIIAALKKHGIRPIILLNANSGNPVPNKFVDIKVKKFAAKGSRQIYVEKTAGIVPNYTGLIGQAYQTMFPIITSVDSKTGLLKLSAPLANDVKAGTLRIVQMKYRPFAGTVFSDGKSNPSATETINGWKKYLQTLTTFLKQSLGTTSSPSDAGFDLEVWNEMTFGSQFLDINNYYNPKLSFSKLPSYTLGGRTQEGPELLLPLTIDFVNNRDNKLPGVRVISGFSNQRPWENGTEMFAGQTGFSRHYYTGYNGEASIIKSDKNTATKKFMSATGNVTEGSSSYIPEHIEAMPEHWFYAYHTEFVVRDIQPYPGPWSQHYRYANPGNGKQAEVWMTETNWWRWPFAQKVVLAAKVSETDPRLISLMQNIGAKATLRTFTFYSHKGVKTVDMYAAKSGDLSHGVFSDAFFKELAANNYRLTDSARRLAGPQIQTLIRTAKLMRMGNKIENPRPIEVTKLVELNERIALKGNGTEEHPNTYNRDDFAILPFQLTENKFAIGYYVVTRDLTKEWQKDRSLLDPQRYAMPAQKFEITLSNIDGNRASVYSYDPLTDKRIQMGISAKTDTTLTVEVESVDYPRFLIVEESRSIAGPILSDVKLEQEGQNTFLSFRSNTAGNATVSWGPYPARSGGSFQLDLYADTQAVTPLKTYQTNLIQTDLAPSLTKGAWKWTGTIVPKYSETYSFALDTNICKAILKIDGQTVINGCASPIKAGTIDLIAGQTYSLELAFINDHENPQYSTLYWASQSQAKEPVTADPKGQRTASVAMDGVNRARIPLPGFERGHGVKIDFASSEGNLQTRFPQWNYDVRGVWWKP